MNKIIFCKKCGSKFESNSIYCSSCGLKIESNEQINDIKDVNKYEIENVSDGELKLLTNVNDKNLGWSWGAFLIPWLYCLSMKNPYWKWLLAVNILFYFMSKGNSGIWIILYILQLIISIYFGIVGKSMALKYRKWENEDHFVQSQKQWNYWAIIAILIIILYFIMMRLFSFSL